MPTRSTSPISIPADPEVCSDRPRRRKFSADQKQMILEAVDACSEPGQISAILRRERIYTSHIAGWRRQRDIGAISALGPKEHERKPRPDPSIAARVKQLEHEKLSLDERLSKAEFLIDLQKEVFARSRASNSQSGQRIRKSIDAIAALGAAVGLGRACAALGVPRASYYRSLQPPRAPCKRRSPPRTLSDAERQAVIDILHSDRFADKPLREICATLLDEGTFLCSLSTMYRLLRAPDDSRERRNRPRHPACRKPELVATGPNQVWSWGITKLCGPTEGAHFYLYVIIDIFSRYAVGWMVATCESADQAARFIDDTCKQQSISREQLTLHTDMGSSTKSKAVGLLLGDLGVAKKHSRPYVSDANPYSTSHFKTLKYRPGFPASFGSLEDARSFCGTFFGWYNTEHRHTGIGLMTPSTVHHNQAEAQTTKRRRVLEAAYRTHPERFVRGAPVPPVVPDSVSINASKASGRENVYAR
ncbi:MAG: IS3 family transposase [Polyangiaceae bacterium]|nr:IS3 family transposase [Polyangiaceae bacterium]